MIGDADLLASLRDGSLPPAQFDHANHLRAAWLILGDRSLPDPASAFRDLLHSYVRRVGAEDKFHRTMTDALLSLVQARMAGQPSDWPRFRAQNQDLFNDARQLLARHYSPARLGSAEARLHFVAPDRAALPAQDTSKR